MSESTLIYNIHEYIFSTPLLSYTVGIRSDAIVFIYPILLISLFLYGRYRDSSHQYSFHHLALSIAGSVIGVFIINYLIKLFITRPRPYHVLDLPIPIEELTLTSIPIDSFPSDHAAVSMTIAVTLIARAYHSHHTTTKTLGIIMLLISIIMGIGRIGIGIHRPSDILFGRGIGVSVGILMSLPRIQKLLSPLRKQLTSLWTCIASRARIHPSDTH